MLQQLIAMTEDWPTLADGTRYACLMDYYPINAFAGATLSEDEEAHRKLISDFGCKLLTTPADHAAAEEQAIVLVSERLQATFREAISELTLIPIPASTPEETALRYERFCQGVAARTGIKNGYGLITQEEDTDDDPLPVLSDGFIYGDDIKHVGACILFDDLISTGNTMQTVVRTLTAAGVPFIAGLALGKVASIDNSTNMK